MFKRPLEFSLILAFHFVENDLIEADAEGGRERYRGRSEAEEG